MEAEWYCSPWRLGDRVLEPSYAALPFRRWYVASLLPLGGAHCNLQSAVLKIIVASEPTERPVCKPTATAGKPETPKINDESVKRTGDARIVTRKP